MIQLRRTRESDLEAVLSFEGSPEAKAFVYQWSKEQHLKAIATEDTYHFCVKEGETGRTLGYGIVNGLKNPHRTLELMRIVVLPPGKGLGRQAMEAVLHQCFQVFDARRLWLDVAATNHRAIHLYESLGFVLEGVLREHALFEGNPTSMHLYGMLRSEYTR